MHNLYQPGGKNGAVAVISYKSHLFVYQLTLIIIVSIVLYLYTIGNNFAYDDKFTVVNNYLIRSWRNAPTIFNGDYFVAAGELSYRPLVTLTYFIDYTLWRLNPVGYHLTNLSLHCLNTILLFFFLTRLVSVFGERRKKMEPVFPKNSEASVPSPPVLKTSIPYYGVSDLLRSPRSCRGCQCHQLP